MPSNIDYNALLLKVMAHDLLAPLTAVKWQIELLEKHIKDKKESERYLKGIAASTELGIALTRHTHIAAKVLGKAYTGIEEEGNISEAINESITALGLQYERHGLKLNMEIERTKEVCSFDNELISLFVWSLGKFFLTCTPPDTIVEAKGMSSQEGKYLFSLSAPNIKEREILAQLFVEGEMNGDFDQTFVFVKLLQEIAPRIHATLSVEQDADFFAITAVV